MLAALKKPPLGSTASSWFEPEPVSDPLHGWPLLATPMPTGFPAPVDDQIERRLSLDTHLIHNPESTFFLRVQGDDLREQGIHDGDLLVVDRAMPPTTGSWVVAVFKGEFALRCVGRDDQGRRVLQSTCPEVADQPFEAGQAVRVWGVVRWAIHRLWPGRLAS